MRSAVLQDGEVVLADRPRPLMGPDDVLVEVAGAGLNGADLLQRAGKYPAPPGTPDDQPGLEFAGEVVATGERVTAHATGERVMGIVPGAAQSAFVATPADLVFPVPDDLDLVAAGGVPEVLITAHDALFTQAGLGVGDRVLVTGAAGGVGTAAIQLARAAGATVVASTRGPDRREALSDLGADEVVGPDGQADAGPYDVVLELVGAPSVRGLTRSLATGARIVVIGVGGGPRVELDLLHLMSARASLRGSTLRARPHADRVLATRRAAALFETLWTAGGWQVPLAARHDFRDVARAYEAFAAGGHVGKHVLVV